MTPLFSNNPVSKDNDSGSHADSGEAVADNQGSFSPGKLVKLPDKLILGLDIERTGGLIENHD